MSYRNLWMAAWVLVATAGGLIAQEKADPAKPAKADVEEMKLAGGAIILTKPASWKSVPPKVNMIDYEFRAPADADPTSRVTVMTATGGVSENIKRWVGQFEGAKESDAKIEKKEVEKTVAHIVEVQGTFKESMGGPFAPGGGATKKREDYALLGAILELEDGSLWFIKMVGPKQLVADEKEGFMTMITGLKHNKK